MNSIFNVIQNSPAVKKSVPPQEAIVRNPRWQPRNGRLMAKIFNNDNSGEFVLPHFTRIWQQIHLNCRY